MIVSFFYVLQAPSIARSLLVPSSSLLHYVRPTPPTTAPTSILIPSCVAAVKGCKSPLTGKQVEVVAAGGIYNGAGLAAALSFGASAVWVGTRFIVSPSPLLSLPAGFSSPTRSRLTVLGGSGRLARSPGSRPRRRTHRHDPLRHLHGSPLAHYQDALRARLGGEQAGQDQGVDGQGYRPRWLRGC